LFELFKPFPGSIYYYLLLLLEFLLVFFDILGMRLVHFLPDVVSSVVGNGGWASGELGQGRRRRGEGDVGHGGHRGLDVSGSCMGGGTLEGIRQGSVLIPTDTSLMAKNWRDIAKH
jgi:hypothetical protein